MQNITYQQGKILPKRIRNFYEFGLETEVIGYMLRQEQKRKASQKWQKIYE